MAMIRIEVENFGPVARARVELKPLTVFIGPNNTGKSYLATLIYAISRAASERAPSSEGMVYLRGGDSSADYVFAHLGSLFPMPRPLPFDGRTANSLQRWLPANWRDIIGRPKSARRLDIPFDSLPKRMVDAVGSYVEEYLDMFTKYFDREIKRCYGARLGDLVCKLSDRKEFSVFVEQEKPQLKLRFDSAGRTLKLSNKEFSLRGTTIRSLLPRQPRVSRLVSAGGEAGAISSETILKAMAAAITMDSPLEFMDMLATRAFYLPAARSGILQGQKALAGW